MKKISIFNNISFRKIFKKIFIFFLVLLTIFILISLFIYFYISHYSKNFIYSDLEKLPENKVGLSLGTSPVTSSGEVSKFFVTRMKAADDLIKNKKIEYVLVSGDNRTVSYNEPKYMRNYLLKLGVDSGYIISDFAGRRTLDSVLRSYEIFNQNNITIISQKFHNERAVFIARKNGIVAIGFNAEYPYPNNFQNIFINIKTFGREILARDIAVYDFLIGKQPEILGDSIEVKNYNILEIKSLILEK
ncbi:MAG: ElyC/SanA/YdcF family protein [Candidatus Paceibacterota bacterium]|jgi:SanA protein